MDVKMVEQKVDKLDTMWRNYKRGIVCNLDGRSAVVDRLSCYEEEIRVLISRWPEKDIKRFNERLDLFKVWRESANWILR